MFKFKVGDKVKVKGSHPLVEAITSIPIEGKEGVITQLGGVGNTEEGAVVTNEDFPSGDESYGEHGRWFPDNWLELI